MVLHIVVQIQLLFMQTKAGSFCPHSFDQFPTCFGNSTHLKYSVCPGSYEMVGAYFEQSKDEKNLLQNTTDN